MPPALVLALAVAIGGIPFANVAARLLRGVDLRNVGSGTVSGTGLHRVAGFGPLAVAGSLDVVKGALPPLVAGPGRPILAAVAGGVAVAAHNWSPYLRGAGGRGVAPALGGLLVQAWIGAVVLALGLAIGRLAHQTGLGTFVALVALVPVLALAGGEFDALAGACLALPILVKRVAGNEPLPRHDVGRAMAERLLYDRGPAR